MDQKCVLVASPREHVLPTLVDKDRVDGVALKSIVAKVQYGNDLSTTTCHLNIGSFGACEEEEEVLEHFGIFS